jgi:hypothetical protein
LDQQARSIKSSTFTISKLYDLARRSATLLCFFQWP